MILLKPDYAVRIENILTIKKTEWNNGITVTMLGGYPVEITFDTGIEYMSKDEETRNRFFDDLLEKINACDN